MDDNTFFVFTVGGPRFGMNHINSPTQPLPLCSKGRERTRHASGVVGIHEHISYHQAIRLPDCPYSIIYIYIVCGDGSGIESTAVLIHDMGRPREQIK